ncbi:MAG: diaminopimelate epimerase [Bacteroidales bacterium]|nr:diaminopimelate epimerase [Bacteroidales bacterium]
MKNFFVKSQGIGNAYIVLNSDDVDFKLTSERIIKICSLQYGIGSDGILLKVPSVKADFGLQIFNPDGSEAEKSGNGLRIFSKYLHDYKFSSKKEFTIETKGGIIKAWITAENKGKASQVKVELGKAVFEASQIPVNFSKKECFGENLEAGDKNYVVHCVSVGNPHCVVIKDTLDENEIKKYGTLIENHPMFPNRINVQFAKVISENKIQVLIWERGAGYTLSSGTSSCAVAAVAVKKNLTGRKLTLEMQGGNLEIEIDESWNIMMEGEVKEIATGVLSNELISL